MQGLQTVPEHRHDNEDGNGGDEEEDAGDPAHAGEDPYVAQSAHQLAMSWRMRHSWPAASKSLEPGSMLAECMGREQGTSVSGHLFGIAIDAAACIAFK
jgi:hypothetical protein